MSYSLVAVTTVIYLMTAVSLLSEGRVGLCVAFTGYAIANVGIILDILSKGH